MYKKYSYYENNRINILLLCASPKKLKVILI